MGTQIRTRTLAMCLAIFAIAMLMVAVAPSKAYAEGFQGRYWDGSRVVDQWGDEPNPTYLGTNVGDDLLEGWYCANESFSDGDRPTVHGTVNIILRDGVTMHLKDGIHVPPGTTLNIYGGQNGTGKLLVERSALDTAAIGGNGNEGCGYVNIYSGAVDVKGGSYNTDGGAGIGGGDEGNGGAVTIYGGTVTAKGGPNAAAIGGGEHGSGGTTIIYGGTVNTTGGSDSSEGGAGIGGGWGGNGGTTRIYGGNVTANGGHDGAGIGGGDSGSGGDIEIHNGTVTANGRDSAAIGGGQYGHGGTIKIFGGTVTANGGVTSAAIGGGQKGNGGDITISGGNVTATANTEGAGIGGGDAGGNGGNITITGGTIKATGHDGAGIGGGDNGGKSGTIKITGGEITAIGGSDAAGIGGGYDGAAEYIEIKNCTIKEAKGGSTTNSGGAGIGGGNGHDGGTIIISNANVTAQGGSDGAGIGGGDQASGGNITISADSLDYTITAKGGGYGSGIGGGQGGNGGTVTINGGTVNATGASDAAGIGGGEDGDGGTVTITGGKVTATGSPNNVDRDGGAGIGGGDLGNGGTVNISGGEVIATGGVHAAGIGGGDADHNNHGNGGNVTITGDAHVTAKGGHSGAGIGAGEEGNTGGTVTIGTKDSSTGPTVVATGGTFAAGIGSGDAFKQASTSDAKVRGADVIIYSGSVTATGGEDGAGIGGGEGASNGTTKIYGGTVVAKAGTAADNDGGAGIGSGDDNLREKTSNKTNTTGGTIEIHGGTVEAYGGGDGAGIGGGDYGSGGNITITGGTVTANGGAYAAGIGGDECRGAGNVTITGGNIRANGGSDSDGKYGGAGIGGGANKSNRLSETNNDSGADQGQAIGQDEISISGNCTVVATGGANAAGIGGGTAGAPGSVTIAVDDSCTVDATGGIHAAGIGGGRGNDGDGEVNAVNYGVSGKITINSGTVTAIGGKNGGSGIGSGAACGDPTIPTVDVTINGGDVIARAGAITDDSQYDSGVAIGSGGKYFKDELKDIELDDDFVIEDEDVPAKFKGAITFNGGRVVAQAATAPDSLDDYLDGALNVIGASRDSNATGGKVEFKGSTVWMWTEGFSDGSATKYSQAVRAGTDGGMIYFTDNPEHQNVFYVLVPEDGEEYEDEQMSNAGRSREERIYALTKYDERTDPKNYGLVVVKPQHDHDFTYTLVDGHPDTILAVCSKQSCTLPARKATLKIVKPLHSKYDDGLVDNDAEKATLEDKYMIQGDSEIEYYKANAEGTGTEGNELEEAPVGAGKYWAQITLGSDTNSATAHVAYTIEKADSPACVAKNAGIIMAEGQTDPSAVVLSDNIKYNELIEDYDPGDQDVTYEIVGDAHGCSMGVTPLDNDTLYTSTMTTAGKVNVKVTVPGDDNYKELVETITVTISVKPKRTVTATLVDGENFELEMDYVTYGHETYVLGEVAPKTASDVWTLAVKDGYEEFIEVDEGSIDVDEHGDIVVTSLPHIKPKKVGEAYIIAMVESESGDYAPSYTEVKVTIKPAEVTIAAKDESIGEGETPKGEYDVTGLLEGDTIETPPTITYWQGEIQVSPEIAKPGKYTIKADGAVDKEGNYTFKYEDGTLTVRKNQNIYLTPPTITYGDTDKFVRAKTTGDGELSYAVTEGSEDYISVDPVTGALTVIEVPESGVAYVTITAAETTDYQKSTMNVPVQINKKPIVIKAMDKQSYVGDDVPDLTMPEQDVDYAVIGLLEDDELDPDPALRYEKGGVPAFPTPVVGGTYDIVPYGAEAQNYAISYENGTLTVVDRKIQVVTASDVVATYGDASVYINASTNGDGALSYLLMNGDAVDVDPSTGELAVVKPGTAYVAVFAEGTENYTPATKEVKVTVRRAQLTITAKDEEIYEGGTPSGLFDVEGLVGKEVGADLLGMITPTLTYQKNGEAVDPTTAPAGVYDIVPSGVDIDGKYTVGYVNGKLTIRADQAINASDVTVTYGDTGKFVKATTSGDGALSYSVKEGGDFVDVNSSTGEIAIKRAGAAVVTVTAAETANYAEASRDVLVTVNRKQATIQADDQVMWINAMPASVSDIKLTATVSGTLPGDTLAYGLSCDFGDTVQARSYPISVTADPNVVPNYNYEITMKSGYFSVTNTNMSVSATGWSGTYDGEPHGINVDVTVPGGTEYSVAYGTTDGTYDSAASPTQTDAGSLTVYYQVTAGTDTVIGSKDVIVEKAAITPSVKIEGWKWGEQPKAPVLGEGSNPGNANVTYEYAHKGGSDWSKEPPTDYGDHTVLATVPETANYLGGVAAADFSVAPVEGTLTFNLDGGTYEGKTGPIIVKANCGDTIELPGAPTKDGYAFLHWKGSQYAAGADYKVEGDHTFTAVWEKQSDPEPSGNAWLYGCVGGAGSAWTQGSNGDIVFTFKRAAIGEEGDTTFEHFVSASVDGSPLTLGTDYTAEEGSVIITLKAAYLATLAPGPHTLTAHFDDDDASTAFTTAAKEESNNTNGGSANSSTVGDTTSNTSSGGSANVTVLGGSAGTTTLGGTASGGSAQTATTGGAASAASGGTASPSSTTAKTSDSTTLTTTVIIAIAAIAACGAAAAAWRLKRRKQ